MDKYMRRPSSTMVRIDSTAEPSIISTQSQEEAVLEEADYNVFSS